MDFMSNGFWDSGITVKLQCSLFVAGVGRREGGSLDVQEGVARLDIQGTEENLLLSGFSSRRNQGGREVIHMPRRIASGMKESVLKQMFGQTPPSISDLVEKTGISQQTLSRWRKTALKKNPKPFADGAPQEQILRILVETYVLNELELGEYCRTHGLYAEQIAQWRKNACFEPMIANIGKEVDRRLKAENKALERELRRKDKALAEAAALLVLSKKVAALWGEKEN
jgi:transposase-like protein